MKKLLPAIFVLITFFTNAQISITSANMPVSGDSARVSLPTILSLMHPSNTSYTATGTNFMWTFDSLNTNNQAVRQFQPSAVTPYFFYFFFPKYGEKVQDSVPNLPAIPLGTITLTIKDIWNFYKKVSTTSFNAEGTGMTISGLPVGATYTDEDELYKFPLNYGDRDSTTFKLSTPSTSLIPFVYKKGGYRITEADGWGYVRTPYGTEPCLRVVTTQYSTDTIIITALPMPFNKLPFPNFVRSYQWLTLGEKIPYFEVSGNVVAGNFTPTQVRYRDAARAFVGIKEKEQQFALAIYPNPAVNELNIVVPKTKELNLEIYSGSGQLVIKRSVSNNEMVNQHAIDISKLAQGLYTGILGDGKTVQNFKFIKQ
jgi:hypothetical protein